MGNDVLSPGGKTVGAWKWQLPPSSGGVKNSWNYAFTDPICLHIVHKDWLPLLFILFQLMHTFIHFKNTNSH
jgi:hypothetical protein